MRSNGHNSDCSSGPGSADGRLQHGDLLAGGTGTEGSGVGRLRMPSKGRASQTGTGIEAWLYRERLRAGIVPNADLIDVKVRRYSPQAARHNLEEPVKVLRATHSALSEPSLKLAADQPAQTRSDLRRMEQERRAIEQRLPVGKHVTAGWFQETLLLSRVEGLENIGILKMRQRQSLLADALGPLRTYSSSTLEPIYAKADPAYTRSVLSITRRCSGAVYCRESRALSGPTGSRVRPTVGVGTAHVVVVGKMLIFDSDS
jgi:hypothetical protein